METIVSGKRVEVTPALRTHAVQKTSRLPRHYDRIQRVDVLLDKHDSHAFEAEVIAHVDGTEHHVSKAHHDDLYACINEAVTKMERQLTTIKEKVRDAKKH